MNNYNDFRYPTSNTYAWWDMNNNESYQRSTREVSMNNTSNLDLYDSYDGYMRGNMFKNLYNEYEDYQPQRLVGESVKEEKLLELSDTAFAAHDLNLYLDVHPDDEKALKVFNQYRTKANQLMNEYENMYGALNVSSNSLNAYPWKWDSAFPWMGGNSNV